MKCKCSLCGIIQNSTAFKAGAIFENCLNLIKQSNFSSPTEAVNTIR